jgi:hypothetical protein
MSADLFSAPGPVASARPAMGCSQLGCGRHGAYGFAPVISTVSGPVWGKDVRWCAAHVPPQLRESFRVDPRP